jgi:hypothetical protein
MKKPTIRPNTYDQPIYNEIFVQGIYDAMVINENDRILDI